MHDHSPLPTLPAVAPHPLVAALTTRHGWPSLGTQTQVTAFLAPDTLHCLFIPGDARRNLETPDAAVILPELWVALGRSFDCAVIEEAIEADLRQTYRALKAPGLLFFRGPQFLGAIEKLRDWSDYLTRTRLILSQPAA